MWFATRPTIQITNLAPEFPWNELDLDLDGIRFRFLLPSGFVIMLRFKMFAEKASFYDESQNPNSFYLEREL